MADPVHASAPAQVAAGADAERQGDRPTGGLRHWVTDADDLPRAVIWFLRLLVLLGLMGIWLYLSVTSHPATPLAGPADVAGTLSDWIFDSEMWHHTWVTVLEAAEGWLYGSLAGVAAAMAFAFVTPVRRVLLPILAAFNALPKLILAPALILWFGTGAESKVALTFSIVFFIVFYTVFQGLTSIDREIIINARVLGLGPLRMLWEVYLPAIFGWIVSSIRLSTTIALNVAVVGEFIVATHGIGHVISVGQQRFNSDVVMTGVVLISVIALALDRSMVMVQRRVTRWRL